MNTNEHEELKQAQGKPVVVVTGGGSVLPLAPYLAKNYLLATMAQATLDELRSQGLEAIALGAAIGGDELEKAENGLAHLNAKVVNGLPKITGVFAGAYDEGAPASLREPAYWPGFMLNQMRGPVMLLTALAATAKRHRVVGIVTHEDVSPEFRALTLWGKARGIPTVHIPHAPCHLQPGVQDVHREVKAEWIVAAGEQMRRFYMEGGVAPEKILMAGAPQWDKLYHDPVPSREEARRWLQVEKEPLVLCYAATWAQTTSLRSGFGAELEAGLKATLEAAKALGAYVMVMVHRSDGAGNEKYYEQVLGQAGVRGLVTRHHLPIVLRAADVLVAQGPSNMCLDAAILGTPSVYLQTEGFDYGTPLPLRTANGAELPQLIVQARAIEPTAWNEFVRWHNLAHEHGGDAAERAAELVGAVFGG